jgi:hypothetical protein
VRQRMDECAVRRGRSVLERFDRRTGDPVQHKAVCEELGFIWGVTDHPQRLATPRIIGGTREQRYVLGVNALALPLVHQLLQAANVAGAEAKPNRETQG